LLMMPVGRLRTRPFQPLLEHASRKPCQSEMFLPVQQSNLAATCHDSADAGLSLLLSKLDGSVLQTTPHGLLHSCDRTRAARCGRSRAFDPLSVCPCVILRLNAHDGKHRRPGVRQPHVNMCELPDFKTTRLRPTRKLNRQTAALASVAPVTEPPSVGQPEATNP